ncbi:MAG TPA: condensation domain-containing protein, partial [Blastocatellia bacterium]|nr:condensation domain-containing protein [Blastocatellia bacterium]
MSEIFSTLAGGGSLHLHPQDRLMPGTDLVRALTEDQITIATLPPTVLAMLEEEELSQLQTVIAAGEACNTEIVERWAHGRRFLNAYGPTESTVCASIEVCETGTGRKPTIGRPLANTRLYILDRELAPVPVGVQGELYVAGVGLARGYWSRPELTAERFIPDLFGDPGGERLYRTGDLVRYLPDGRIEFIGRADTQVKIRGYRIELGEIEAILNEHRSVSQSAVVMSEEEGGDRRIIGYVVGETDATADELKRHVRERLPEYMVPGLIRLLKEMPVTANGKIDRKRLPFAPLRNDADHWMEPEETGARTPIEEILMGIFEEVLKVSGVGRDDNFFGIGGHSLLATQVVSRVRTAFGLEIGVKSLFERATARELARKIEALMSGGRSMEAPPLVRASRQAVLPLSFAQQRLWFLDQLMPNNPFYNCLGAVRLEGRLGIAVLERSINEVVRRHEVLRTRIQIIDDEPAQMIEDWSPRSLERVDLSHLDPERRDAAIHEIMREEAGTGFDLSRGPLLKIKTLKLGEEEQVVLLTMHHIVSDGWSMGILIREVGALYRAYSAGEESPLPELEIQYADYAVWQRNWLRGEALDRQLRYWEEQLAGVVPLELPTDYPHPATASYRGANLSFELSETLTQGLHELSRREGGTMFMTLLAAFQTLLMRYSGQEEITVGSPIANRTRAETERLIGFFVNTLVLRTRVERNLSFRELLRRVREVCLGAYAHQDLPFEQLVGDLQPERDLSRQPLFQVMLILQNAPSESLELPGLRMSKLEVPVETSKFDLLLATAESKGRLVGSINYSSDLFEAATIERLIEHLRIVLEKAVADPGGQVSMIEYLTDRERQQILEDWNETRVDYPSEQCLHELFEQQVERSPDAVAMVFDGVCLSYRELNRQANQLAHHLQGLGSGPEKLIGICVERSVEMIVGLIGILKSGAAYLPLDPAYPAERLHLMLRDAEPLAILAQERLLGVLPEFEGVTVCLDRDWPLIAERSDRNLPLQMASGNPAYVIYTSGSTGRPKGVLVPHRQVINFFIAMNADLEPDPEAAWLAVTSISFDISVLELLWTLARGFRF